MLRPDQIQGIIEHVQRDTRLPVAIQAQDPLPSYTKRPHGKVPVYNFILIDSQSHHYFLTVGTQVRNQRKNDAWDQKTTLFVLSSTDKKYHPIWNDKGSRQRKYEDSLMFELLSKEGMFILQTAISLARQVLYLSKNLDEKNLSFLSPLIDTSGLSTREEHLNAVQESLHIPQVVPANKTAEESVIDDSNSLSKDTLRRITDIINQRDVGRNFSTHYQDKQRLGKYDWEYRFGIHGDKDWQVEIGTTTHHNYGDYSEAGIPVLTAIKIRDESGHRTLISNHRKKSLEMSCVQAQAGLANFRVALALINLTLEAIFALPGHRAFASQRLNPELARQEEPTERQKASQKGTPSREVIFAHPAPSNHYGDVNYTHVTGYLQRKPVYRVTRLNQGMATFLVVSHRGYLRRDGTPANDYLNCVVWGNGAKDMHDRTGKGTHISLTGRMHNRAYEDRSFYNHSGQKRYFSELNVDRCEIIPRSKG